MLGADDWKRFNQNVNISHQVSSVGGALPPRLGAARIANGHLSRERTPGAIVIDWLMFGFGLSLFLNHVSIGGVINFTPAVALAVIVVSFLVMPRRAFGKPPPALLLLGGFILQISFLGLSSSVADPLRVRELLGSYWQLWILGVCVSANFHYTKQSEKFYWGLYFGACVVAFAIVFVEDQRYFLFIADSYSTGWNWRRGFLGMNPNKVGLLLALANTFAGIRITAQPKMAQGVRLLGLMSNVLLISAILATGSRGALGAAVLGSLLATIAYQRRIDVKSSLRSLMVGSLIVLPLVAGLASSSESFADRMSMLLDPWVEGSRTAILKGSIEVALEHPILGAGPDAAEKFLNSKMPSRLLVGDRMDPHSFFGSVMLYGGIVGLGLVFGCIFKCFNLSVGMWRIGNPVPLAMLLVLMIGGLSGSLFGYKVAWVIFAFGAGLPRGGVR